MGSSINHSVALNLKNKGNSNVSKGDVVIIDKSTADAFTLTGSVGLGTSTIGVVLDQVGITTGSSGMIIIEGYCPQINLVTGANIGDTFYLSSVQQKAQSHSTILPGDFGQTLSSGITPDAILWSSIINPFQADYIISLYTGSNINLGTSVDSGFVDADATNAVITFTPQLPGKYMVTFILPHYVKAASIQIDFRLTDGSFNTPAVRRFQDLATADSEVPINLSYIFNWTTTTPKTIKLQKWLDVASTVSFNYLDTNTANLALIMSIYRIGS